MRVLLSDTWGSGGASTFVATLARGLASRGHEVDVVVGYSAGTSVEEYAGTVGRVFRPPTDFTSMIARGNYDILHGTEDDLRPPFDYARRIRRLGLRTSVVITAHQEHAVLEAEGAEAFVFVSEASRNAMDRGIDGAQVIPNGVDQAWLNSSANETVRLVGAGPVAVWVGRIEDPLYQKDFRGFCYAIPSLLASGWRIAVMDGSAPSPNYPVQQELDRWLGGAVTYANQVSRGALAGVLMQAARTHGALVSTSRYEAAPFIALEALAVGCPVVAPAISGYEALRRGGYLTTYEGLAGLLDVLSRGNHLGARRDLPEELNASVMIDSYLELYTRVCSGATDRPRAAVLRAAARLRARTN